MAKGNHSGYKKMIDKQYKDILKHCQSHMEQVEITLPEPKEDLHELLKSRGFTRRDFVKWTSAMTAALMLPPIFKPMVAKAAENFSRIPVVWLHFAECTGCSESLLRSSYPNVDDILLETISLEYHETLMAASGDQAEKCLEDAIHTFAGKFICVIEGALPKGLDGNYLRLGPKGKTGIEIAKEVAGKAAAVIAIGSCSAFGNIQAAKPNPTNAVSIKDAIGVSTVNIAGCPPNAVNFTGTLLHYIMFGGLPALDGLGRPIWAYGKRIHDYCERRPHYDASEFVEEWGDAGALKGWCLYRVGCKGPYTYANCGKVRFNDGISWPIMAGHGCIGCTEPDFWDTMAPLEKPLPDKSYGGGEKTVDTIGIALTGITALGIAAHATATALRHGKDDQENKQEVKHE